MIDFLNENAGGIQAIFAALIFCVTLIYVIINSLMHKEMVKTREREEKPVLSIRFLRKFGPIYSIVIENISNTSAHNIRFIDPPDIKHKGNSGFPSTLELGLFKYPINYMGPKQSFESIFLNLNTLEDEFQYKEVNFQIEYFNDKGNKFNHSFDFNISMLHKTLITASFEEKIVDVLNEIKKSINKHNTK